MSRTSHSSDRFAPGLQLLQFANLHAAFEASASRFADNTALGGGSWQPTYCELNAAANRVAHSVAAHCVVGDRVAILMQHDTPVVAAVLAGLKAGQTVLALDPLHPPGRLQGLVDDAGPRLIITDAGHLHLAQKFAAGKCGVLTFDPARIEGPSHNLTLPISHHHTSILVYTSGSTGRPKGVMQTHGQLLRNTDLHTQAMAYNPTDYIPLLGSLSAGQAYGTIFCALFNGAQLFPYALKARGTTGLATWLVDNAITTYTSSASIFRQFAGTLPANFILPHIRAVWLSSEAATDIDYRLFQQHFSRGCRFVHTLSSTETALIAVHSQSAGDPIRKGRLPIGRLTEGIELLLLDEQDRPVERGDIGEIIIRSRYLAAGYWRQPALTSERFSGEQGGMRQFRTGDLARFNSIGLLEHAGRKDSRVKIRGNRVETAEVEDALHSLPGIERAVVECVQQESREPALVAFLIDAARRVPETKKPLRIALRDLLPDFMIPSAFVNVESFPLTSSGKVDREKLRREAANFIQATRSAPGQGARGPRNRIQEKLLELFSEVLNQDSMGIHDDFFLLGGDSLAAVDLLHRIEKELQYQLSLALLMEAPTVAKLEARLESSTHGAVNDVIRVNSAGKRRPLFAICGRYGHILRLLPVLRSLNEDQPSYGLQPPGMDWRTVGCTTIAQMAAHYLRKIRDIQAEGPYRLIGTSFGGLVVYEIALQLQAQGERVEFLGLVDTSPPACLLPGSDYMPRASLREELAQDYEPESIEAQNQSVADMHVRARREYLLDARSPDHLFQGALTYFYCTADPIIAKTDRRGLWKYLAPGGLHLLALSGSHGWLHKEPQASALQELLQRSLEQAAVPEADSTTVFEEAFQLMADNDREQVMGLGGDIYKVENDSDQGCVQAIERNGAMIKIAGWAVEACKEQPAKRIAVFCNGRYLGCGSSGFPAPGKSVPYSRFVFHFWEVETAVSRSELRLFVLSEGERAAELH